MDLQGWFLTLHNVLPKSLCDALGAIYRDSATLTERYYGLSEYSASAILGSLSLQAILPPIISFLVIYFTLISLYRTTSFVVRSAIFLIKWGAMIGIVVASLGYIANTFGAFDQSAWTSQSRRRTSSRLPRPRAWDTFQQHQQWSLNQESRDAGRIAKEMVEKIVDVTKQAAGQSGLLGTLAGMAVKTVTTGDPPLEGTRKRKGGKGKGKSR